MSSHVPLDTVGTVTTIVFGTCAIVIGVVTIHQGSVARGLWYAVHPRVQDVTMPGKDLMFQHHNEFTHLAFQILNLVVTQSTYFEKDLKLPRSQKTITAIQYQLLSVHSSNLTHRHKMQLRRK